MQSENCPFNADMIDDLGVFNENIPLLEIRRGDFLVSVDKKIDIRGQRKDQFVHLFNRKPNQYVTFDILKNPDGNVQFDRHYMINYVDYWFGFCHMCIEKNEQVIFIKNVKSQTVYTHNHMRRPHEQKESLTCQNCSVKFSQIRSKKSHLCDQFSDLENPVTYKLHDLDGEVGATIKDLKLWQAWKLCFSLKIAIPEVYPALFLSGGFKKMNLKRYGCPTGSEFIYAVLSEMEDEGLEEGILIDKNIHIEREGGLHTIFLGNLVTRPLGDRFIVTDQQNHFHVQLKYKHKEVLGIGLTQPLDDEDLIVYQDYSKSTGRKFSPHR